ncbi:hypothetical protein AB7M26_004450 [Pseudomonas sp. F-14 TE3482]
MRAPSSEDTLNSMIDQKQARMFTSMPAVITGVNLDSMSVNVQPAINELYSDGEVEEFPEILSVPLIMPGSRKALVSFPVEVGDTVMLIFAQRSMDNFKLGNGRPTQPNDYRKHDMQDAIAIPGLFTFGNSANKPSSRKWSHNTKDVVIVANIGGNEAEIRIAESGDITMNTEFKVNVNAKDINLTATNAIAIKAASMSIEVPTTTWLGDYSQTGNYDLTGEATFNGIAFSTHRHTGVTPGSGTSAGPIA